jgi:CheY-like chemotaxis protein
MPGFRILLVGERGTIPVGLAAGLRSDTNGILADIVSEAGEAVAALSREEYAAAVCWTKSEDELRAVIRLRKASPDLPILVLSADVTPEFAATARLAGATRTVPADPDVALLSKYLRTTIESGDLRREHAGRANETPTPAKAARRSARSPAAKGGPRLVPLVVEDDPAYAALLLRAFEEIGLASPLPILKSGEEAIDYLSHLPIMGGAARGGPVPTIVLMDVGLPGMTGFDVLTWIRKRPALRRMPVVMLTVHADVESITRAYQVGANSFLVKPTEFRGIVDLVSGLQRFWGLAARVFDL